MPQQINSSTTHYLQNVSPEGILQGFYLTLNNWESQIQNLRRDIQYCIRQFQGSTPSAQPARRPVSAATRRKLAEAARRRQALAAEQSVKGKKQKAMTAGQTS